MVSCPSLKSKAISALMIVSTLLFSLPSYGISESFRLLINQMDCFNSNNFPINILQILGFEGIEVGSFKTDSFKRGIFNSNRFSLLDMNDIQMLVGNLMF